MSPAFKPPPKDYIVEFAEIVLPDIQIVFAFLSNMTTTVGMYHFGGRYLKITKVEDRG